MDNGRPQIPGLKRRQGNSYKARLGKTGFFCPLIHDMICAPNNYKAIPHSSYQTSRALTVTDRSALTLWNIFAGNTDWIEKQKFDRYYVLLIVIHAFKCFEYLRQIVSLNISMQFELPNRSNIDVDMLDEIKVNWNPPWRNGIPETKKKQQVYPIWNPQYI